jgi:co-chaperonin GroES (HSP10)
MSEHASGQFNISNKASTTFGNAGNTLFSVGNGIFQNNHNAFEIRQNGDIYITLNEDDILLQDKLNNFATKSEIPDTTNFATKSEIPDTTNFATKDEIPDTTNFATKDEIPTIPSFKTINGEEITGTGNIELSVTAGEGINITDNVISSAFFKKGTGEHSIQIIGASQASGSYSLALGNGTTASGSYSHAEGLDTTASGQNSHTEGYDTHAEGYSAHAEGAYTTASGDHSHAEGAGTTASNIVEHASGSHNISHHASDNFGDAGNTLFSVGNGKNNQNHNAFEIRQNGDIYIADSFNGEPYKLQDKLNDFATKSEINSKYYTKTEIDNMVGDINNILNEI